MRSFTKLLATTAVASIAIAAGCTVNMGSGGTPSHANDGTTQIDQSRAQALVQGQVQGSLQGDLHVTVNDTQRDAQIAPDQTFVVRDVPTGDVTLGCEAGGVRGTVVIEKVQPGEVIEVTVRVDGDAIVIIIERRTTASEPPREVTEQGGDALEIDASHVCYWMKPGTYTRDVTIVGNEVHLIGAAHDTCVLDDRTVLKGTLTIKGDDAVIYDVDLQGKVVITGKRARIQDTCDRCFDEGCTRCGDDNGGEGCHHGDDDAGATEPDAAVPPVDAAPPAVDAGLPPADASTSG